MNAMTKRERSTRVEEKGEEGGGGREKGGGEGEGRRRRRKGEGRERETDIKATIMSLSHTL